MSLRRSPYLALYLSFIALLLNFALEASSIFIPLFARELGASNFMVGVVGVSYGVAFFLSSAIFGRESDRRGRVIFIKLGTVLSALAFLSQTLAQDALSLMLLRGVVGFCLGISSAALLAYVYEIEGNIGKFSSYGSLGWFGGEVAAIFLQDYQSLFVLSALLSALAFVLALPLKESSERRLSVTPLLFKVAGRNSGVYLPFFLRHLGATALWTIFPLFLAGLGASKGWIAILSLINTGGQFLVMRMLERFNPSRLFKIGFLLSALTFILYALASNYYQVIPIQILLAVAWSYLYIGASLLLLRANLERATATGLLQSTTNLSGTVGPFMGGTISQFWGFTPVMYFASALALTGFLIANKAQSQHRTKD